MHLWSGGGGSACTLLGSGDPAPEAEPPALVAWRVLLPTPCATAMQRALSGLTGSHRLGNGFREIL